MLAFNMTDAFNETIELPLNNPAGSNNLVIKSKKDTITGGGQLITLSSQDRKMRKKKRLYPNYRFT